MNLRSEFRGAPKFEERTQDETLKQERCARREAWDLAKDVCKVKKEEKEEKDTFYSPAEAWVMQAPSLKKARSSRIRGRLRSVYAHAEQKRLKLKRTGNSSKIQEPHNGGTMVKCKRRRNHKFMFTILISS